MNSVRHVEELLARAERTAGLPNTAGSRVLADFVPAQDAAAVARLRETGAIIPCRTSAHP